MFLAHTRLGVFSKLALSLPVAHNLLLGTRKVFGLAPKNNLLKFAGVLKHTRAGYLQGVMQRGCETFGSKGMDRTWHLRKKIYDVQSLRPVSDND